MLLFGFRISIGPANLVLYFCLLCMGTAINFLYQFLFGSTVI